MDTSDDTDDQTLTEEGVALRITSSSFPVQVEGTVDGREVYYRARHCAWDFTVYNLPGQGGAGYWHTSGDDPHCGAAPEAVTWALLRSLIAQWRGGARTVLG